MFILLPIINKDALNTTTNLYSVSICVGCIDIWSFVPHNSENALIYLIFIFIIFKIKLSKTPFLSMIDIVIEHHFHDSDEDI